MGYTMKTADAATTGAEYATNIQERIPSLKENSHSLPNHVSIPIKKVSNNELILTPIVEPV
jgi:hypothetical protein